MGSGEKAKPLSHLSPFPSHHSPPRSRSTLVPIIPLPRFSLVSRNLDWKACGGGRVLYRFYLFWWKWQRWSIRSLTPLSNLLHWHLFAITCCLLRTGKIAIFCIASEGGRSLYFNYEDQEQTQLRGYLNNGDKPIIFNCLWVRGFCDGGFEQQRFWATGSESFSPLICLDAAKFILLKWFYS